MVLYFFMGCIIVPMENQDEIIKISHDGFIEVYSKMKNDKNIILNELEIILDKK